MKIDHDYFLKEFHAFRAIMTSTEKTPEQKFDAWGGLLSVYFLCESKPAVPDEEGETRKSAMEMLMAEFPLRMGLELASELEGIFLQERDTPPYCDCIHMDEDYEPAANPECGRCGGEGYVPVETRRAEFVESKEVDGVQP